MISLHVRDYCQNCPDFQPDVEKNTLEGYYDYECITRTNTTIFCAYRKRCALMYERLTEELKEK